MEQGQARSIDRLHGCTEDEGLQHLEVIGGPVNMLCIRMWQAASWEILVLTPVKAD